MSFARIFGSSSTNPSSSATTYAIINALRDGSWVTTEASATVTFPISCEISDLRLGVNTAPGVDKSWTMTLRKNGSDTAQTVTLEGYGTERGSMGEPVAISAGDTVVLSMVPSNSPSSPGRVFWSMQINSSTAGQTPLVVAATTNAGGVTRYFGLNGSSVQTDTGILGGLENTIPLAGSISGLRVECATAPAAGRSFTYTLWKNGSATALTAQITAGNTTGQDLTNSVPVSVGDYVEWRLTHSNNPGNMTHKIAAIFTSSDSTKFPVFASCGTNALSTTTTTYNEAAGKGRNSWANSVGGNITGIMPGPITIHSVTALMKSAPGAGTSRSFNITDGTSSLGTTVADTNTLSTSTGTFAVARKDVLYIESVRTGSASSPKVSVGFVASTEEQEIEEPAEHTLAVYTAGDSWAAWSAHRGSNTGTGSFPLWSGVTFQNMNEGMGSNGVYGATFGSGGLGGVSKAGYTEHGILKDRADLMLPEDVGMVVREYAVPGSKLSQWASDIPDPEDEDYLSPASGKWMSLAPLLAAPPPANTARCVFMTLTGNDFGGAANTLTLVPRAAGWDDYWTAREAELRKVLTYVADLAEASGAPIELVMPSYHNFFMDDGDMVQYPPHANNRAPKKAVWMTQGMGAYKQWETDSNAEINAWADMKRQQYGSWPQNTADYWKTQLNGALAADILNGSTSAHSLHNGYWAAATQNITGSVINGELQKLDDIWENVMPDFANNQWVRPYYFSVWDEVTTPEESVEEGLTTTTPANDRWVEGVHLNHIGYAEWIDVWLSRYLDQTEIEFLAGESAVPTEGQLWPRALSDAPLTGQLWPR